MSASLLVIEPRPRSRSSLPLSARAAVTGTSEALPSARRFINRRLPTRASEKAFPVFWADGTLVPLSFPHCSPARIDVFVFIYFCFWVLAPVRQDQSVRS